MKGVLLSETKNHIPEKKKRKQPWISQTTLKLAEEGRKAKADGYRKEWSSLNSAVTKSVVEDLKCFLECKCEDLEKCRGESKKMFGRCSVF